MKYVFGSTLVCSDAQVAERVTFDKGVRTRAVTLQGDMFDPAGTLTGGSQSKSGSVLAQLQTLNTLRAKLAAQEEQRAKVFAKLTEMEQSERGR